MDFLFLGYKITVNGDCSHEIRRWLLLGRKAMTNPEKQRHHFADKSPYSQGYDLSSSHVRMWKLDNKEGRATKSWCFRIVVLEKTLESPLENKEIKPVNLKGNQSWKLFGRTNAKAEASILWPPDADSWFIGKDPENGQDWRQKRATENEMVGWYTNSLDMNLDKLWEMESDMTWQLNNNHICIQIYMHRVRGASLVTQG